MITRKALNQFWKRERSPGFNRWKDLTDAELEDKQLCLPVKPPIWEHLLHRQKVCFLLGVRFCKFAYFNGTGTGKTLLCIALARYFKKVDHGGVFLALVPNKTNKDEWLDEVMKHSPSSRCLVLRGSSKQKWDQLREGEFDLVVETFAGLIRMLCVETFNKKKKRIKLKPDIKRVKELKKLVTGLFVDEVTVAKNRAKLPYRICRALSKSCKYVFALSGTPFGRDPTDLWAQMMLVDDGHSLGQTLGLFRAAFFTGKENYWGGTDWTFDKTKADTLHKYLGHRSIRYEIDKNEMPRVKPYLIKVPMSVEASDYYMVHRRAVMEARGNFKEMKNAFNRMRQISSGFLGYKDDDTGERAQFEFNKKPKLDGLMKFLWNHDGKAVVFHDFRYSGKLICRALEMAGIGFALLNGATSENAREIRDEFRSKKRCEVLVLNNSVGGFGLNLQVAKWAIFYESPVGAIMRNQTQHRVERQFSEHEWIGVVDLVTKGTVDEQILEYHAEGKSLFDAIVRGRANL